MAKVLPPFYYQDQFPLGPDETEYELLTREGVSVTEFEGQEVLKVELEALTRLANEASKNISFMLRSSHLEQVASVLTAEDASENDKAVALTLLRNAEVAAQGILPFCQDTGTASIKAKKGQRVWTGGNDAEALTHGIYKTYTEENLRYSQMTPLSMFEEKNTGTNLPAQVDLYATDGDEYKFLFIAKGGGSANKMFLYQETKALLNEKSLEKFIREKIASLGTAACPPYHLSLVIGGTSAEANLAAVKMASTRHYDALPTEGNEHGQAFRDLEWEERTMQYAKESGIGAQFGGKYYALDARVIRLPRHGASCPVGLGVSCSADRQAKAKITRDGIFIEKLEKDPGRFIPEEFKKLTLKGVKIDLNQPMPEILKELSQYPITTRVELSGTIVVGRDIVHAKLKEMLDRGEELPDYIKNHPIYYAGPAKTPEGMPSGSFGPTTAGRMDSYVELFQKNDGSMIMLAKGNRSQQVTDACQKYGGFYLGSIGGPAALLAQDNIKKVEVLEWPELGMEAIWKIEVQDFPAYILVDDKGNDFFRNIAECPI